MSVTVILLCSILLYMAACSYSATHGTALLHTVLLCPTLCACVYAHMFLRKIEKGGRVWRREKIEERKTINDTHTVSHVHYTLIHGYTYTITPTHPHLNQ
jgi:hypothetical protein